MADGSITYPADTAWRITGWKISEDMAAATGLPLDAKPHRNNDGYDLNLRIRSDLGFAELTAITAYQKFDRKEYNDWDSTRIAESDTYFYNTIKVFSQEARLASHSDGPLQWMVGAHYAKESNDGGFYTRFRNVAGLINTAYGQDVQAFGLFTHNNWQVSERLNLIAGLRWETESRRLDSYGTVTAPAVAPAPVTYKTHLNEVSGRLGLEYDLTDNAMLYASLSRGVKSGGFTTYNATSATPFKPEIVIAYEAGIKSDLWDRRLRLNGALFYYDYRDQQVQGLEYSRENGRLGKITNVPKSRIWGGEIELTLLPMDGLTISQNLGYKTGKYLEYDAIDGTATDAANPVDGPWDIIITNDRSGERLGFPKLNYGGQVAYDWALKGWDLRAETNYNYRDDLYSITASSVIDAYWLFNASLSVGPSDANWRVALWSRNLFDTYYEETRNGFNSSSRPTTSPRQGRTVGVRLSMEF